MRDRALLLAVPSAAMAVVGLALFGPGAVQPFDGAQVWGGPTEGVRRLSWRIAVVQRLHGIDSTHDVGPLVVRARTEGGVEGLARCRTRADGHCDVELDLPESAQGRIDVMVTRDIEGSALAEGTIFRGAAGWDAAPGHPARLTGASRGDLQLEVSARRGVFAAPFRDELVVSVRHAEKPLPGARITLRSDAADLDAATPARESVSAVTSPSGEATFELAPRTHSVDVSLEATAPGLTGSWDGLLPVVPGAIWLDPAPLVAGKIRVVAPVPRGLAYATLSTRSARLWGGIVPLSADEQGFATGEIAWPPIDFPAADPLWLTLASDPRATGSGTVGWPIARDPSRAARDERPFRDWLLLDGLPAAEERDRHRRHRARGLSATALGAAAVLEGVLLARTSQGKERRSWVFLVIAIATVALAFAAMGIVVIWKTSG